MIEKRNLSDHSCLTNLCKNYNPTEEKIPAEKKRKKYLLINNSVCLISKYDIDDCVFKDIRGKIERFTLCDYVIVIKYEKKDIYIWIELKGVDENKACTQISNTIDNAVSVHGKAEHFIRIISSRSINERFRSDDNKSLRRRYDWNNHFLVRTNSFEEEISKLFQLI